MTNEWQLAQEDDALRERKIPEGLQPALVVEGRAWCSTTSGPRSMTTSRRS